MSPRDLALTELDHRQLPGWERDLLRGSRPSRHHPTDARDFALAEQITLGVIQNHLHLQWLTEHYSGRRLKSIDPLVQKILSVGLYQLRFLDRIPESAAVNEAVEQAKRFGRTKAAGFVNAVLRKSTREPSPAAPDRTSDPAGYAERVLSHPRELFWRLAQLLGATQALRLCEHDNREPPTVIRLMPGVDQREIEAAGITLTPHEQPGMYVVEPAKRATLAGWAERGQAQVQDPTAAGVAAVMRITPGLRVLDRCAGLGTKTMQLRELVGDTGELVAIDPATDRIFALLSIAAKRGFHNIAAYANGLLAEVPKLAGVKFDRALVDVPCSNSGVLARRPEARYAQTDQALISLDRLQRQILDDTAAAMAPRSLLVYSTCSIWPDENQRQVDRFLARHSNFTRIEERTTLPALDGGPTRYHDGGYFAVLELA